MIIDKIFKAPLVLLVISSFFAALYVYIKPIPRISITLATPVALGMIIVLYFIGSYIKYRGGKNVNKQIDRINKLKRIGNAEADNTN